MSLVLYVTLITNGNCLWSLGQYLASHTMLLRLGIVVPSRFFLPSHPQARTVSSAAFSANEFITKVRQANKKNNFKKEKAGVALITCKRKEFDHYVGQNYSKFEPVPLASSGWHHKQSKGDYFVINGISEPSHCVADVTFEASLIVPELTKSLESLGITKPTQIQTESIPVLLSQYNCLIAAETGCGKTLAYLLPVLQQIMSWQSLAPNRKLNTPLALIISPSRELAHQIMEVASQLTKDMSIHCHVLTGGHTKRMMMNPSFQSVDLLVATIGALSKLSTVGVYQLNMVRHVVLDEADTLLDDSFVDKLGRFLRKFPFHFQGGMGKEPHSLPQGTQLTLVSATMPTTLPEMMEEIVQLDSLQKVTTGRLHQFLPHVSQEFIRLSRINKPAELLKLVKSKKDIPMIIFSNKSSTCDWISMFLNENGLKCVNLNGEMPFAIRNGKFEEFQSGRLNILSCTDIGSRGLDTIRALLIINYDFPLHTADYIHRCGRTGRVGSPKGCCVVNFVAAGREIHVVQKIETAARKMKTLPKVDGNIANVIYKRILNKHSSNSVPK